MTLSEVKKNYNSILGLVQEEVKKEQETQTDEDDLEEAIKDILEGKKSETSSKKQSDKDVEGLESITTTEEDDDNEVEQDEESGSTIVTESQMQSWIETLNRITPKR